MKTKPTPPRSKPMHPLRASLQKAEAAAATAHAPKARGKPFQPGASGNPRGRERGSINASTRLRKLIDVEKIITRLQVAAFAGDVQAARTLLERALPVHRATAAPVEVPGLVDAKDFTGKAEALFAAVAEGRIAPDIGASLISAVGAMAKLAEIDELRGRVSMLERKDKAYEQTDDELMRIAAGDEK